jgi:2-amino-4-hydroxy-6-hydroxymethyldihydropteridine diphosphokinase
VRRRIVLPAVIALGSNLGDREENLRAAVSDIGALNGVSLTAVSGIVQSHAVKPTGTDAAAPDYLNAVMLVQSALHPEALLVELNRIEADHGRVRSPQRSTSTSSTSPGCSVIRKTSHCRIRGPLSARS